MSRSTNTNFSGAFRVVTQRKYKESGDPVGNPVYTGPYQSKAAAKGMLTRITGEENYYNQRTVTTGYVEIATGWEPVEK